MRGSIPPRLSLAALLLLAAALLLTPGLARWRVGAADTAPAAEHAKPHPSVADVKNELTTVIDAQLGAFRANDFAKAYTFAAGPIKEMFNAAEFEGMVRKGYPVIAHSTDVDYGMAFDNGEEAVIYVRVQNKETKGDGQYQYLLHKEDGAWKIGGVSEVKAQGMSV